VTEFAAGERAGGGEKGGHDGKESGFHDDWFAPASPVVKRRKPHLR